MKCSCGSQRFVFSEVTITNVSFIVDFEKEEPPGFDQSHCSKIYTFTCVKCGKTYSKGRSYQVDNKSVLGGLILYDMENVVRAFEKEECYGG